MDIQSKFLSVVASLAIGTLVSTNVSAASTFTLNSDLGPLDIDFRDAAWQAGHGQSSHSVGGITVYAYDSISVPISRPIPGELFWENDGFGVNGGDQNDEIDGSQGIAVVADSRLASTQTRVRQQTPSITAAGVWLNDFFATTGSIAETGRLSFFSFGSNSPFRTIDFSSDVPNLPGSDDYAFYLDFGGAVSFEAVLFTTPNADLSEYAVAGFNTAAPVPLPPAIWMLGSAMVFLFRKKQS